MQHNRLRHIMEIAALAWYYSDLLIRDMEDRLANCINGNLTKIFG